MTDDKEETEGVGRCPEFGPWLLVTHVPIGPKAHERFPSRGTGIKFQPCRSVQMKATYTARPSLGIVRSVFHHVLYFMARKQVYICMYSEHVFGEFVPPLPQERELNCCLAGEDTFSRNRNVKQPKNVGCPKDGPRAMEVELPSVHSPLFRPGKCIWLNLIILHQPNKAVKNEGSPVISPSVTVLHPNPSLVPNLGYANVVGSILSLLPPPKKKKKHGRLVAHALGLAFRKREPVDPKAQTTEMALNGHEAKAFLKHPPAKTQLQPL